MKWIKLVCEGSGPLAWYELPDQLFTTVKRLRKEKKIASRFEPLGSERPAEVGEREKLSLRRQSGATGIFSAVLTLAITNDEVTGTPSSLVENEI